MDLITFIVAVAVLILVLWLLSRYVVPALPAPVGTIVLVVVALLIILWLLSAIGVLPGLSAVRVG